jgi:DNA invertase Pin-like site-specific DNA recombinase
MNGQEKITASHLQRAAIIYVRQSTLIQVRDNKGSTERQYEQRQLARELGWAEPLLEVIDEDLGKSGTKSEGRSGFQRLVAEVAMGKCGAVFGVEVSRLSRSNADWYRLLDLCAANDTLVLDDGRVHDPSTYDDRLLLGLKGTMADSEIHMMLSRLQGGRYRKALRGEYWSHAPVGYVRAEGDRLLQDPDERVRHAVEQFFKRHEELGSADAVVRDFTARGMKFPLRGRSLEASKNVQWIPLRRGRALYMLHNPVYAGAFSYGRRRKRKPRWAGSGPWPVLLKGRVEPYLSWEQFMKNQKRIQENRSASMTSGAPRRGGALLQGIAFCGKCGRRMGVAYQGTGGKYLHYQCRVHHENSLRHVCLSVTGKPVDRAVAARVVEAINRENIAKALEIAREVEKHHEEDEREWKLKIESSEYEAQRAFRQYNGVEPENRLVARTLERAWEEKLEEVERVKEEYAEWAATHPSPVKQSEHKQLVELLKDFEQVWEAPTTSQEERKVLLRILVQDVTLRRDGKEIVVGIRWRSGMTETLRLHNDNAPNAMMAPAVLERIRTLSTDHLDSEIAKVLNAEGYRSTRHRRFTAGVVRNLRQRSGIRKSHAGEPGYYTPPQLAAMLGVSATTVITWCTKGKLKAQRQGKHATYWIKLSTRELSGMRRELARTRRTGATTDSS